MAEELPIVDVGRFAVDPHCRPRVCGDLTRALADTGFAYVRGLPLPEAATRAAFSSAWRFFKAHDTFKRRFAYGDVEANFGYQGLEGESLDPGSAPDLKESFTMRNAVAAGLHAARWPDTEFRRVATAFYSSALDSARLLLQVMAASLELPQDFFVARHGGENVTLRYLHYPSGLQPRARGQLGAGQHTDYGSITLLFQGEIGGLEVRGADGRWRAAPVVPGCVLLNTGDLMERWTNGRFRSTPHRVPPIAGARNRLSISLFVDPDSDVEVDPLCGGRSGTRLPPITAGEHLRRRIAASHEVRN